MTNEDLNELRALYCDEHAQPWRDKHLCPDCGKDMRTTLCDATATAPAPAPDVTLRDVLVLVRGIANVICLGLADQMDDKEATGRMLAIRDDADAMLRRKEGL